MYRIKFKNNRYYIQKRYIFFFWEDIRSFEVRRKAETYKEKILKVAIF